MGFARLKVLRLMVRGLPAFGQLAPHHDMRSATKAKSTSTGKYTDDLVN